MTSERAPQRAFVWVWLPGSPDPVVAGRLDRHGDLVTFTYARSYLERPERVAVYEPELPLRRGVIPPGRGLTAPGCINDAAPDAWGHRVLRHQLGDLDHDPDLLTQLLWSDSDRFGAMDFQASPDAYEPRTGGGTLPELLTVVDRVNAGDPVPATLADALLRGTSLGGARPKAALRDDDRHLIAKFGVSTDSYDVVSWEGLAMQLAARVGLDVAPTGSVEVAGRRVLLVERFDRGPAGTRHRTVSALTILGLDALTGGRYATYADLADQVRLRFSVPAATLRELFARIAFNMCVTNTDDHARNHAALILAGRAGDQLQLAPAYDICPQPRTGDTAYQAMAYGRDGQRETRFAALVEAAANYQLDGDEARAIIDAQVETIWEQFGDAADAVGLPVVERNALWRRQVLHPSLAYGYGGRAAQLLGA